MIQVYLCEDQEKQLLYFKQIIEKYITDTYKDARIVSARKNPEHILLDMRECGENPALFFIDIQLDGYIMNGFELAKKIKKNVKNSYIVFLQIAIQNGHLCHVRRSVCDIIGGQPKTN